MMVQRVADTAGPSGDLGDVENRVAALQRCWSGTFAHGVIRTQDQVGHTDIEPAMQPGLAAADGVQPAEGNREAAHRFPLQVVVETLRRSPGLQAGAVSAFNRLCGPLPWSAVGMPRRITAEVTPRRQNRRALQVQKRAVQNQAGDTPRAWSRRVGATDPANSDTMSPPAECP